MQVRGKVSWFGGPDDPGVTPSEGLAFIYKVSDAPYLFLPYQPPNTTGLARRLDPDVRYVACRWDYNQYPKPMLLQWTAQVTAPKTGRTFEAYPADWGPNQNTGRIADISPGLMSELGIKTDDEVEVIFPFRPVEKPAMTYQSVVISSGHSLYVRGAAGVLDEVDEARAVVDTVAVELRNRGVDVKTFHDDVSRTQNENLSRIVNYHNGQVRQLDVSVHFNAYQQTDRPMGTEVLYVTQSALAGQVSAAIAASGHINRGAKKRTDLYFLNKTAMPAILIEVCFVDSTADAAIYNEMFGRICAAIATVLGGKLAETEPPDPEAPPTEPPIEPPPAELPRVDIAVSGDVIVTVNGVAVMGPGLDDQVVNRANQFAADI